MIREEAVVVEVKEGQVVLAMSEEAHAGCGACNMCRRDPTEHRLLINVPTSEPFSVGDHVSVEIPGPGPAFSSVLLMGIPLVLFIAGVLIGNHYRKAGAFGANAGEIWPVLVGAGAMVLWYIGINLYDRALRKSPRRQPKIVRKMG